MAGEGDWTNQVLDAWMEEAETCWAVIEDGRDMESIISKPLPEWSAAPLNVQIGPLTDLLTGLLLRHDIEPEPFYRAIERIRVYQLDPDDLDAGALAIASLRSALARIPAIRVRLLCGPTEGTPRPSRRQRSQASADQAAQRKAEAAQRDHQIRMRVSNGESQKKLAAEFGITAARVSQIVNPGESPD
jgi:hypothetical protein